MEESEYHLKATPILEKLLDHMEGLEEKHDICPELESGILSIIMPDDREYVINKHMPSRQIWVSSPYSGASYFEFKDDGWNLKRATNTTHHNSLYDFIVSEVESKLE